METWICSVPPSTTTSVICPYVFAGVFLRRAADMFFHAATLDFVPQLFTSQRAPRPHGRRRFFAIHHRATNGHAVTTSIATRINKFWFENGTRFTMEGELMRLRRSHSS